MMKHLWISMLAVIMFVGMIGIMSAQADSIAPSDPPVGTNLTVVFGTAPVFSSQETMTEALTEERSQEGTTSEEHSEIALLDESTTTSEDSYQESVVPDDVTMNEVTIPNTQQHVENSQASGAVAPSAQITPVPEPSTLLLVGIGILGLLSWSRRKKV